MRNDTLEEVELNFYGFTKRITVNVQGQRLRLLMAHSLYLPYEVPVYWVFVKVHKGHYTFDHIEQR